MQYSIVWYTSVKEDEAIRPKNCLQHGKNRVSRVFFFFFFVLSVCLFICLFVCLFFFFGSDFEKKKVVSVDFARVSRVIPNQCVR